MKLSPDQIRLKELLKETITLLCKNGASFEKGLQVEAVIGVTTDDTDVLLVSINQTWQKSRDETKFTAKQRNDEGAEVLGHEGPAKGLSRRPTRKRTLQCRDVNACDENEPAEKKSLVESVACEKNHEAVELTVSDSGAGCDTLQKNESEQNFLERDISDVKVECDLSSSDVSNCEFVSIKEEAVEGNSLEISLDERDDVESQGKTQNQAVPCSLKSNKAEYKRNLETDKPNISPSGHSSYIQSSFQTLGTIIEINPRFPCRETSEANDEERNSFAEEKRVNTDAFTPYLLGQNASKNDIIDENLMSTSLEPNETNIHGNNQRSQNRESASANTNDGSMASRLRTRRIFRSRCTTCASCSEEYPRSEKLSPNEQRGVYSEINGGEKQASPTKARHEVKSLQGKSTPKNTLHKSRDENKISDKRNYVDVLAPIKGSLVNEDLTGKKSPSKEAVEVLDDEEKETNAKKNKKSAYTVRSLLAELETLAKTPPKTSPKKVVKRANKPAMIEVPTHSTRVKHHGSNHKRVTVTARQLETLYPRQLFESKPRLKTSPLRTPPNDDNFIKSKEPPELEDSDDEDENSSQKTVDPRNVPQQDALKMKCVVVLHDIECAER